MSGDWFQGLNFTPKISKPNTNLPAFGTTPVGGYVTPGSNTPNDTFVRSNNPLFGSAEGVSANVYGVSRFSLNDASTQVHPSTFATLLSAGRDSNFEFPPI